MDHAENVAAQREERSPAAVWERGFLYLLFAALGALLSAAELFLGVRPFGVALAAASGLFFPAIAAGGVLFDIIAGEHAGILAMGVLMLGRLAVSLFAGKRTEHPQLFAERVGARVTLAALAVLAGCALRLFTGDFRYYYLLGLLLGTLAAALGAFLLCGLFFPRDKLFPYSRETGLGSLLLLCVFATRGIALAGIYPAAVCAALIAFWLAAHYGGILGALAGALLGVCFDLVLAPAFALCGVGLSLLKKNSRGGGVLAGCALAGIYAFSLRGSESILSLLPSLMVAGALFLAVDNMGAVEGSSVRRESMLRRRNARCAAKQMQGEYQAEHLREVSGTLHMLSGILHELSGKERRPGQLELRHLCDRELDRVCPTCPRREICWGSEYQITAQAVAGLGAQLYRAGRVAKEHVPQALASRCTALPGVLERINTGAQQLFEEAMRGDKTSVVAMDYAAMGHVITDALSATQEACAVDEALGERVAARLLKMGYVLESVSVCGKERRCIRICDLKLPGRRIKPRELRRVLEQSCRLELGEARVECLDGRNDYTFDERTRYGCTCVKHSRAKSGREGGYCGDSVTFFTDAHGRSFSLLCDGMGSGNGAALTSALCASVLSRLLQAGVRAETALRMLNSLLAARSQRENEASSTVDLLEVDNVSGKATLYKCGAAPTYLLRAGQITRFFSRTAPIGILDALDAERLCFEVRSGDVLVQVSDGVTGGEEECLWLSEMLQTKWEGDAEGFARMVINHATERDADDLSVLVTRVSDAPVPWEAEAPRAAG
jgi:stage II sporulation protein E